MVGMRTIAREQMVACFGALCIPPDRSDMALDQQAPISADLRPLLESKTLGSIPTSPLPLRKCRLLQQARSGVTLSLVTSAPAAARHRPFPPCSVGRFRRDRSHAPVAPADTRVSTQRLSAAFRSAAISSAA